MASVLVGAIAVIDTWMSPGLTTVNGNDTAPPVFTFPLNVSVFNS